MHIGKYKINKNYLYLLAIFIIVYSISLGFSNINTDISVNSTGTVKKYQKMPKLNEMIKNKAVVDNIKSEYVESSTGIDFSRNSSSTNGQGVYLRYGTENDEYPIYYYRGNVTNNNVIFAKYCWKIVRTTETGGTKIIYNGTPTDGKCTNTTGESTQLSTSYFNPWSNSPAYVGYMYGKVYSHKAGSYSGTYGNDVTYSEGQYTLSETSSSLDSTHHYTCANSSTSCETVRYYYYNSSRYSYYIELTEGTKVEEALEEMFINTTDSTIKDYIENTWYESNMTSYTEKLEDTIYCNDRSIYDKGAWNPNGGSLTSDLYYGAYGRIKKTYTPILECSRAEDKFTVSDKIGNGKLTYPVGLLTTDEVMLAGLTHAEEAIMSVGSTYSNSNSNNYLYTNSYYWLFSPYYSIGSGSREFYVTTKGDLDCGWQNTSFGVRPVVSLQPDTEFVSGDGTSSAPYVIQD